MVDKQSRVFIAGHRGLVGSAMHRVMTARGFSQIITRTRDELDLLDQSATAAFFLREKPEVVVLAAARVGGRGNAVVHPEATDGRQVEGRGVPAIGVATEAFRQAAAAQASRGPMDQDRADPSSLTASKPNSWRRCTSPW